MLGRVQNECPFPKFRFADDFWQVCTEKKKVSLATDWNIWPITANLNVCSNWFCFIVTWTNVVTQMCVVTYVVTQMCVVITWTNVVSNTDVCCYIYKCSKIDVCCCYMNKCNNTDVCCCDMNFFSNTDVCCYIYKCNTDLSCYMKKCNNTDVCCCCCCCCCCYMNNCSNTDVS